MGTMSVLSTTLCLTLEVLNGEIWFLDSEKPLGDEPIKYVFM